ncbi:MAG: glutamate mutase L [Acidimicrobiales bacterium]
MNVALLADFGSTFTKVVAVDLDEGAIVGQSQSPNALDGEILDGYDDAVGAALSEIAGPSTVVLELAASSAGGGLRMAAVGLVRSLTALAAKTAALNAGARLESVLAGNLTSEDAALLRQLEPEIVLFAGGTDGGQERLVLHNAEAIAGSLASSHVVVACNSTVATSVQAIFEPVALSVTVVPNVLPDLNLTRTDETREAIAAVFIDHVIAGKHLSASDRFRGLVTMATPDAVLRAARLYAEMAEGAASDNGVVVTDVGGATTDVYSVQRRRPAGGFGIRRKGIVSLPVMRTVQGDLGLRSSAPTVLEADRLFLQAQFDSPAWLAAACERRRSKPTSLFPSGCDRRLDDTLAVACMSRSMERHFGSRSVQVGLGGRPVMVQEEPDLTACRLLVAGGGILRAGSDPEDLVQQALQRLPPSSLAPRRCQVVVDRRYVLSAAGLLSRNHPRIAEVLLRKELPEVIP